MDIQTTVKGFESKTKLREYAEERITTALQRFEERILNVTIWLEDVTGPEKQGVDKLCRIEVHLKPGRVVIEELGDDMHTTLGACVDRLKAAISRQAGKTKRGIGAG